MLQSTPTRKTSASLVTAASESQHRRKLFVAMIILFATLIVVLIRDGQLWFASSDSAQAPTAQEEDTWVGPSASSQSAAVQTSAAPAAPVAKRVAAKPTPEKPVAQPAVVATNRVALPPLNIEVVAGDAHQTVHVNSKSSEVTAKSPIVASTTAATAQLTKVSARAATPSTPAPAPEATVIAEYPLLAGQMKVQGSVLLQALIGADGVIEDLRVISGPAILSVAARQAVLQYRFKPYLQNGQPVETSARVTVNFAIRVLGDVTARLGGASPSGGD